MWAIAAGAAIVAGFVRGFTGFGGPAIMSLILIQLYDPMSVVSKVVLIDALASVKLLPSTAREFDRKLTGLIVLTSILGVPFGVYALLEYEPATLKQAIALAAAICSGIMLMGWRMTRLPPAWAIALVGFGSGVVLGATFIALTMVVFLFASPAPAAVSRANAVYWGFSVGVVVILGYSLAGILSWDDVWRSGIVGLVYLAGVTAGSVAFRATNERDFRRAALWLLVVLSVIALLGR